MKGIKNLIKVESTLTLGVLVTLVISIITASMTYGALVDKVKLHGDEITEMKAVAKVDRDGVIQRLSRLEATMESQGKQLDRIEYRLSVTANSMKAPK